MSLNLALTEWSQLLGEEHVVSAQSAERSALAGAQRATHPIAASVLAVIRPSNLEQVRGCLSIASRHQVAVYPSSCGKSWGLGSKVPPRDAVLLDLSRLTRISRYDAQLGSVEVEPGVTFQQLYDFLKAQRSRFFLNVTGSSPFASVLANALERGDGAGPYADRFAHVCGLEVALSSGELVHTGFAGFQGETAGSATSSAAGGARSKLSSTHRWGVGPALDGLFSQSNLGVVTRMCLWLRPLPRSLHVLRFGLVDPGRLGRLCDALAELRLDGTLNASIGVWNDYRVVSTQARFPRHLADPAQALPRAVLERMPEWPGLLWSGTTAIYASSPEEGHARRQHVERCLTPLVDQFSAVEASGEAFVGRELLSPSEPAFKFLQGMPHEHSLQSVYWRKPPAAATGAVPQPPTPIEPEADGCGVIWVCAAIPFVGREVVRAVRVAEERMPEYGFEPLLAFVAQSERCVYFVPMVVYDRDEPGADERAQACHDRLYQELRALGHLPYRLGSQSMAMLPEPTDDRRAVLERLKAALDPCGIIAPGRYDWS